MTTFPNLKRLTTLVAALACLAGCGSMPSAPVLDDSSARVATNGTQTQQAFMLPIDDPAPSEGGVPMIDPAPEDELPLGGGGSTNQGTNLTETQGGTVRSGRWRIEVPPGAVTGSAYFSVSPSSAQAGIVSLGIYPSEKNDFAKPVLLVADCRNVPTSQMRKWFISWYNPATGTWVRVPGSTVDTRRKTVSAPLSHFSMYMVGPEEGRAGW